MKETEFLQPPPPPPSSAPPPPPPPPSSCFFESQPKISSLTVSRDRHNKIDEVELEAVIQRLLLSERYPKKSIFYLKTSSLVPQLQDGPKCGLVALSIATSITKNFVNVQDIFEMAIAQGFTKQGEIFNANDLAILAEKLGFKANVLDGGLNSHLSCILKRLLSKCLLLVPYDADFNHAPCCKKGSKAHWAIISGFVLTEEKSENENDHGAISINSTECGACENSTCTDELLYFYNYQGKIIISKKREYNGSIAGNGKVYLIGLQGKSKHIGLWSFDDMALSNNNLIYFPHTRNPELYIVPVGGVVKGLKGRAVVLEHQESP